MGRYIHRPNTAAALDYGQVDTDGQGTVLADANDGTGKKYYNDSGSILTYPLFPSNAIPGGRPIIAVRAGHRQRNLLFLFNGWPCSYLRYGAGADAKRQTITKAYVQDGYSEAGRAIEGPPLYNLEKAPWTVADLNIMSTEIGAAVGEIAPNKNNRWCFAAESYIIVVYADDVPVPSSPYPANNQTIDTSSVNFSAAAPASQPEQPVQTIFQACRVSSFDNNDVRTFEGGLNALTAAGSRSYYASDVSNSTYTNLGPGDWYLRIKNRDYLGTETAWSAPTKFTITHGALPNATVVAPAQGATVATPYAIRTGRVSAQPSGGRKVGITWQYSKTSDFSAGIVQWTNSAGGSFYGPTDVSYDPTPDPSIVAGLNGAKVSSEDVSQYLSQGTWYARARATDVWGQSGPWSGSVSFTVTHPPQALELVPTAGVSFDQNEAPVRWKFTDGWGGDRQSAAQLAVADANNNILYNSGKVQTSVSKLNMSVPAGHLRENLKIGVSVWDGDDVMSTIQLVGTFRLSTAPVTTISSPTEGQSVNSGQPLIQWSGVFAAAGITQKSFQIKFTEIGKKVATFDSGEIAVSTGTYLPPKPILKNSTNYQLALTVTDSENLSKTIVRNFYTSFDRPEPVATLANSFDYGTLGYVSVSWPIANPDQFFKEWRVYRKKATEDESQYVLAGVVDDPSVRVFQDWLVAGDGTYVYSVVQAAYRFGSIVESNYLASLPISIYSDTYWLIVPTAPELNIKLAHVSGDKLTDNQEMADYTIINGGRRRAYGTRLGISGNLTVGIRHLQNMTATEFKNAIRRVCRNNYSLMMRDPFGSVTQIALGEMGLDRTPGVGNHEMGEVDLPYVEVGNDGLRDVVHITSGISLIESPPGSGLFLAVNVEGGS